MWCCVIICASQQPLIAGKPLSSSRKGLSKPDIVIGPGSDEEQRLDWQQAYLARLCEADPQIRATYELLQEFTTLLRER
jgi:hypothetical protein